MRVKEESERAGLKFNIQTSKIMASGPMTSWQIEGEKVETVTDFIFLGSKITAESDCILAPQGWLCHQRHMGLCLRCPMPDRKSVV